MKLLVRLHRTGFPELYELIDEDTGERIGEPCLWHEAKALRAQTLETLKAIDGLSNIWGWAAQA